MSKKEKVKAEDKSKGPPAVTPDFFNVFIQKSREKFGDSHVLVGSQEEESQWGLELPAFSLQYLFHSNILPFGKVLASAGTTKSFKSSFLYWMFRLCMERGGYCQLAETENKTNLHYLHSYIGQANTGRYMMDSAETVEQAQDIVTSAVEYYKENCRDNSIPMVIGVDSIAGNTTEESRSKIADTGHAERSYPEAALLWTMYFKKLSGDLIGKPIIIGIVNHLKDKIADENSPKGKMAPKGKTKAGGVAQDFHAAQYNYMAKVADIDQVSREGKLISIKSFKCGLGPDNRDITVPVLWTWEGGDEDRRQVSWFDWHAATARLLVDKGLEKRIAEVSDVTVDANRYWSKRLGLAKVSDTEMGQAIFEDKKYMADLRSATGYRLWRVFGQCQSQTSSSRESRSEEASSGSEAVETTS